MHVEKYDFDLEGLLATSQGLVDRGASCSDVIIHLHEQGVSLVDSVEVISDLYKIDMTTGKKIVFSHPIWRPSADSAKQLHDALIKELKSEGKLVEKDGYVTSTIKL